jgi:hypothetical protein
MVADGGSVRWVDCPRLRRHDLAPIALDSVAAVSVMTDCHTCLQERRGCRSTRAGTDRLRPVLAGCARYRHRAGGMAGAPATATRHHRRGVERRRSRPTGQLAGETVPRIACSRGCENTYIAQFAEAEGFAHVHFHIVPRSPKLPDHLPGPALFAYPSPPTTSRSRPTRWTSSVSRSAGRSLPESQLRTVRAARQPASGHPYLAAGADGRER